MSLKAFHILFITLALLMCLGLGAWGLRTYQLTHEAMTLYIGVGSLAAGVVMGFYGAWFLKKLRNVSFI
jgi:DNA-binding transcriptional regulator of glucitol operon